MNKPGRRLSLRLAERFAESNALAKTRLKGDTCARYSCASFGLKRCQHYIKGGPCRLPNEFMCVEWLKVNGHTVPVSLEL